MPSKRRPRTHPPCPGLVPVGLVDRSECHPNRVLQNLAGAVDGGAELSETIVEGVPEGDTLGVDHAKGPLDSGEIVDESGLALRSEVDLTRADQRVDVVTHLIAPLIHGQPVHDTIDCSLPHAFEARVYLLLDCRSLFHSPPLFGLGA